MNYIVLGLLISIGNPLMLAMEPSNNTLSVEQLIEKKAIELSTSYQAQIETLEKKLVDCESKIQELEKKIQAQSLIPLAPPLIASTKLPAPPRPEKPATFFENNKKILFIGGIGVLTAGGILWKLNATHAPKDYYAENAR